MERVGLTATQEDLERFFGVAPSKRDADVPWPYNGFTYNFTSGAYQVTFCIRPADKHIELSVRCANELTYQLDAPRVSDLCMLRGPSHDALAIVISTQDSVFIRLLPSVLITQQAGDGT